ncbi:cell division protein [Mycoplasmopsis maculosa]|uniref:Cell division protein FtsZ n=1 Tax=Mycoplasmopsis maculosa TaxID=114885 RepID=A0A449B3V3_9BACT|nr:cell division protein FtsZ [Mycoplasmopsis maculosa]VEU75283.1 cell division protein [Mycoplasmopsis maculosa]
MDNTDFYEISKLNIKIIGVGGAGNNAINLLINDEEQLVKNDNLFVANTDAQDLNKSACNNKILLGGAESRGFGAGGNPEKGKELAEKSIDEIKKTINKTDLLILVGGLGGGTGTGALPVFAKVAKELGILTVAFVTTPFEKFEGSKKRIIAINGLDELKKYVDSYVVISNQKLSEYYKDIPLKQALLKSNVTLKNAIKMINDILNKNGTINIDFNDISEVLRNGQETIIVSTKATGKDKVKNAVDKALKNTLFESEIKNCKKLLLNYHLDSKGTISQMEEASKLIYEYLNIEDDDKLKVIPGVVQEEENENGEKSDDFFIVNVIASGLNENTYVEEVKNSNVKVTINENHNEFNYEFDDDIIEQTSEYHSNVPGFINGNLKNEIDNEDSEF